MYFRPRHFLMIYVATCALAVCLMHALSMIPGLRPGLSVVLVLPLLIAATIEGREYARAFGTRPSARQCWRTAAHMCALLGAVVAVPAALVSVVFFHGIDWSAHHILMAAAVIPVLRIGFGLGVASELTSVQDPIQ